MSAELAARLQAALATHDVTGGGGMSATVMTADGTWSGTIGKADGGRDLRVDDQFPIASITKSVVAAQVMLMVEAGELDLDALVSDRLPGDFQFDTNGASGRGWCVAGASVARGPRGRRHGTGGAGAAGAAGSSRTRPRRR